MGSSRSITFSPTRPLRGWGLDLTDRWAEGQRRFSVLLTARLDGGEIRTGVFAFRPETEGYDVMEQAADGHGVEPMHMAAEYLVNATRFALLNRPELSDAQRAHWQPVVDAADKALAAHVARYPGGVPAFEVVGAGFVAVGA